MKKFLLNLILILCFSIMPVYANTTQVQNLDDISLKNPPETVNIKILSNVQINENTMLFENYIVTGKITEVNENSFKLYLLNTKIFTTKLLI